MEEKYEEEMENERQANQRLREQMEQLRDDCESLRRALQKTQDEVCSFRCNVFVLSVHHQPDRYMATFN